MTAPSADRSFSLTRGGPFYQLLRSVRLVDGAGSIRWGWLAAIAWAPLVAATLLRMLVGRRPDAIMLDPSVHVRLLVSLPLLVLAENLLETRCRGVARLLRDEHVVPPEDLEPILDRAERLRDSRFVEGSLAVLALIGGQATLWGLLAPTGIIHGVEQASGISAASLWFATVSLPLAQFLTLRWLWRWGIWTYVLVRLARRKLDTNALHPDGAAGLGSLSLPIDAFALFVANHVVAASAAWIAQVREHGYALQTYVPRFVGFLFFETVLACGPLLLFAGQIYRARRRDVATYHALAQEYVGEFRRKWIFARTGQPLPSPAGELVGSPDIQSLNDLGGAYATAARTRAVLFATRPILLLWVAALVAILPLLIATMPLGDVARYIGKMMHLPLL